ncbi:alkaline phosphatase [Roseovarius sp. 22II1-1F6A]|nr:alkaline phosphatase [Roseovarius sp. 22II1-1F6A]
MPDLDAQTRLELEAAAFRRLQKHLMEDRTDVQNIDLMNMAGFCRNCLSRWYQEAANARGIDMDKAEGRAAFYGMPYAQWVAEHQTDASPAQQAAFNDSHKDDSET